MEQVDTNQAGHADRIYRGMLTHVLEQGERKQDRTGTGTISVFGHQVRYDLAQGFPLLTTKRVFWKGVVREIQWFLRGETNIRSLLEDGVHIWSEWPHAAYSKSTGDNIPLAEFEQRILGDKDFAEKWGDIGPCYGAQWRRWTSADGTIHDQVANAVEMLRVNPYDRGIIISGWNVPDLSKMSLRPCHTFYQWSVSDNGTRLDCHLYQRSADIFLGVPFNMASAALWIHMMARATGLRPGHLIHSFGDLHVYSNHLDQVREQMARAERPMPSLKLASNLISIDAFASKETGMDSFALEGYNPWPTIKAPVAI